MIGNNFNYFLKSIKLNKVFMFFYVSEIDKNRINN